MFSKWRRSVPIYFKNITVLNPGGPIGHSLRIHRGRIAAIDEASQRADCIIDGQGGLIIPGMINAHDHLELNTFKRLKYQEQYMHSRQWIEDIEARFDEDPDLVQPRQQPLVDRLWVSAFKNLLSGVTTVCHHNPLHKPLKRNYPIRVVQRYGFCHSLFRGDDPEKSYQATNPNWPWIIHLAEGVDAEATAEFDTLDQLGLLRPNTVLVHGVGLTVEQQQTLAKRGGGLIWCPASNEFLFGRTADVEQLAAVGKVALGSDSRLTGADDLLAELQVAHQTGQLDWQQLFRLVTIDAANLLRLSGVGSIVEGAPADFVLLPSPTRDDLFSELLGLNRSQIVLVMVGGKPLVGAPQMQSVFEAANVQRTSVFIDGQLKLMADNLAAQWEGKKVRESGISLETK